jgi:DNA-binding XRE family transcriptional regulator
MARTKRPPISTKDRGVVGSLLREVRRAAGFRSVDAAARTTGCPAARQTIYAYERGGLTPSLPQFLELIEFYVLDAPPAANRRSDAELRTLGTASVARALQLRAYHVVEAWDLIARMDAGGRTRR